MRRYYKMLALFGVLLLFVAASAYQWRTSFAHKENLVFALERLYDVRLADQELQLQLNRSATTLNNDDIVRSSSNLHRSMLRFTGEMDKIASLSVADEMAAAAKKVHHRRELLESYKSYHAVMKNSIALLNMLYTKRLAGEAEAEFIDNTMMARMQKILLGYYSGTLQMEEPLKIAVKKGMKRPELLLAHVRIIYEYHQKLQAVATGLEATAIDSELLAVAGKLEEHIAQQEEGVKETMLLLFGSAILFLIVGNVAYYQEARARLIADGLRQELQQFVDALNESAIVSKSDPRGKITFVNKKFCEISGYADTELLGQPHNIIRHPDMPASVFAELWDTIQHKRVFKATIKNRRKDGESYYVDSVVIPILGLDGEIVEYLAVRYEVTELIKARDEAMAAEKAKDSFFSNMSHELRTPLNAILGFSRLLYNKSGDAHERLQLKSIVESSEHLLALINDILDLSKIQSGKFMIDPHPFHAQQSFFTFVSRFDSYVKQEGVTFRYEFDDSLNVMLQGDWTRIVQVLSNLVSNAIKFTPKEGTVLLKAAYADGMLEAVVADTGIGMSADVQERIFKPFEQADSSTTRHFGGTGLGLSITTQLVEIMHGQITVKSREGEGSSFTVLLPLEAAQEEQSEAVAVETEDFEPLNGTVLVAEDNKTNQMLIGMLLEEYGLAYDIANDGREAVKMFAEKTYELVLMDENMPNMSGIEAMQRIKESDTRNVPIIALTANVMQGDRLRFEEAGMDGFIGKPIDEAKLYKTLRSFLKK